MSSSWSPVVATGGNQGQIGRPSKPQKQAKSVATGCHRLREKFHGQQGVCRGLPPVAGGPLPAREEVDLLKTPSPANPRAHRTRAGSPPRFETAAAPERVPPSSPRSPQVSRRRQAPTWTVYRGGVEAGVP